MNKILELIYNSMVLSIAATVLLTLVVIYFNGSAKFIAIYEPNKYVLVSEIVLVFFVIINTTFKFNDIFVVEKEKKNGRNRKENQV